MIAVVNEAQQLEQLQIVVGRTPQTVRSIVIKLLI